MSDRTSADYYRAREQQERASATTAVNAGIAAIHTELADRYSDLIAQAGEEPTPNDSPTAVPHDRG